MHASYRFAQHTTSVSPLVATNESVCVCVHNGEQLHVYLGLQNIIQALDNMKDNYTVEDYL